MSFINKTIFARPKLLLGRSITAITLAFLVAFYPAANTTADTFDEQIKALQGEIQDYQAEAGRLRAEADTLENAVRALNIERAALQTQIEAKEVELEQLKADIAQTMVRINNQKAAMGQNFKSAYLEGDISSIEMVFSSKSISDYIDKQEYRNKIRESIQGALARIKQLKADLEKQKSNVEKVLNDQKAMRKRLVEQEAAKNALLEQTKGQEAEYQSMVGQKNSEIEELRAQQRAANLKFGGAANFEPRGGGYPSYWADPPMDSIVDDWGMYNRECVSYTAFRVAASGRYMPYWGGRGNANQWDDNARSAGISVDSTPQVGDVAVWSIGYYGHVMYVEAVYGDGSILISEYNYDWTGRYSERVISASQIGSQGLEFIHF